MAGHDSGRSIPWPSDAETDDEDEGEEDTAGVLNDPSDIDDTNSSA